MYDNNHGRELHRVTKAPNSRNNSYVWYVTKSQFILFIFSPATGPSSPVFAFACFGSVKDYLDSLPLNITMYANSNESVRNRESSTGLLLTRFLFIKKLLFERRNLHPVDILINEVT